MRKKIVAGNWKMNKDSIDSENLILDILKIYVESQTEMIIAPPFTNLSNAIVSEGYINLGFLGVILMAIFLAYFIAKFMRWHRSGDYLKEFIAFYFAIHLIFLLRGDLTNGVSYFVGPLLSVYFLPKIFIKALK